MESLARLLGSCSLHSSGKVLAEYVWIEAGCELRCRTKVLDFQPASAGQLPVWHYEDASPAQGGGRAQRVCLRPCAVFPDPFREEGHLLVLCDTYQPAQAGKEAAAHASNTRRPCAAVMEAAAASGPVFSVEQQYTLLDRANSWPLGARMCCCKALAGWRGLRRGLMRRLRACRLAREAHRGPELQLLRRGGGRRARPRLCLCAPRGLRACGALHLRWGPAPA